MAHLARQRCRNHATREAVARCMSCREYFCRECVVEHENKMTCTHCLALLSDKQSKQQFSCIRQAMHACLAVASFALCYLFFYLLGRGLVSIAHAFNEIRPL